MTTQSELSAAPARAGTWSVVTIDWAFVLLGVAAASVFYFSPWAPIYLAALAVVSVLAWSRPGLALVLVPLAAPFFDLPKQLGSRSIAPSEIFLALIAGLTLVQALLGARRIAWSDLWRSPFTLPAALLLVGGLLSSVVAADRHHALQWYLELIVEPVLFYYLVLLYSKDRPLWKVYVGAVVFIGAAMALLSIAQLATGQDLSSAAGASFRRVQALYRSPDNLGLLFDRVIPLTLALFMCGVLGLRGRVLLASAGVLCLISLVLTYSRGAWTAVAVACFMILAIRYRQARWLLIPLVLLGVAALAFKGPSLAHAFQSGHSGTVQRRLDIWRSSEQMLRDHPILGIGPDNFIHYYAPVKQSYIQCPHGLGYMQPAAWQEPCLSHPHNIVLDFWLSTGLIGLAAFLWIEVEFWRIAWRKVRSSPDAPYVLGAMGAMFAGLIHGLVDNSYFLIDLSLLFWLLCAVVTLARSTPTQKARSQSSPPP